MRSMSGLYVNQYEGIQHLHGFTTSYLLISLRRYNRLETVAQDSEIYCMLLRSMTAKIDETRLGNMFLECCHNL